MVFPIPAKDLLVVTYSEVGEQVENFRIFSLEGKMVENQKTDSVNNLLIPLSEYPNGFYFLELLFTSGKIETVKFLKN